MKEEKSTRQVIAETLKQKRKEAKISVKDVADFLGVKPNAVYAWEGGQNQPDAETLLALCSLYHVEISAFYSPEPTPERKQLSDEELELLELWHNATPESRSSVLMVLRCNQRVKKEAAIS